MANLIGPESTLLAASFAEARLGKNPKPNEKAKFFGRFGYTAEQWESAPMKVIRTAVIAAARDAWGTAKADAMIKEDAIKLPFRKDVVSKGYPEVYVRFVGASSFVQPGLVGRKAGPDGKPLPIKDVREFYNGCLVRASYSVRTYGTPGGEYAPGVSLDLRNVQWLADGERIARDGDASEDFGALDKADAGSDDMADLL